MYNVIREKEYMLKLCSVIWQQISGFERKSICISCIYYAVDSK